MSRNIICVWESCLYQISTIELTYKEQREIDVSLNHLSQNHVIVNFAHQGDGETLRKALLTTFLAAFSAVPAAGMAKS